MMQPGNIGLVILLLALIGCSKISHEASDDMMPGGVWKFYMTKTEVQSEVNLTFGASLLSNDDEALLSDGSYCMYTKMLDTSLFWFYPCRVDGDTGVALDASGNAVDWDEPDWYERVDKDSKYALRAPSYKGYTLVMSSPAVRMKSFNVNGMENVKHWGFHVDRDTELYISEPIPNLNISSFLIEGSYVYSINDATLYDRRSYVTVKIACGQLSEADIKSVFIRNVMTSAFYIPKSKTYENPVMDGGYDNPLDYYTSNTYASLGVSGNPITGDVLIVPDGEPDIHLVDNLDLSHEWDKESNVGGVLTAIADIPIFSLDYSTREVDKYRFNDLIPEIVVNYGKDGNMCSTVRLPANIEPMKSYTVMIYLSTAYAKAELFVADWDEYISPDIEFGKVVLPATTVSVAPWDQHESHDPDDGIIAKSND